MIYHGAVHPALTLALYALAVARGSVLVTEDRITEAPRERALAWLRERRWREFRTLAAEVQAAVKAGASINDLKDRRARLVVLSNEAASAQDSGYLVYLLTCQWCVSIWLALPAVVVWWNWPTEPWSLGPVILLAFSMITGKLSQIGG